MDYWNGYCRQITNGLYGVNNGDNHHEAGQLTQGYEGGPLELDGPLENEDEPNEEIQEQQSAGTDMAIGTGGALAVIGVTAICAMNNTDADEGMDLVRRDEYDRGLSVLLKAHEEGVRPSGPNSESVIYWIAETLRLLKRRDEALKYFAVELENHPDNPAANYQVGILTERKSPADSLHISKRR